MSLMTFDNCTVTIASGATTGTITGDVTAYTVAPGMTLSPGSNAGESGASRIIQSWTPNGTTGASFTLKSGFAVGYSGAAFVVNSQSFSGNATGLAIASLQRVINYLAGVLGIDTNFDSDSRTLVLTRSVGETTFSRLLFKIGSVVSSATAFQWIQKRISGADVLVLQSSADGTTLVDAITVNRTTGRVVAKEVAAAWADHTTTNPDIAPSGLSSGDTAAITGAALGAHLIVSQRAAGAYAAQIVASDTADFAALRRKTNGAWQSWRQIFDSGLPHSNGSGGGYEVFPTGHIRQWGSIGFTSDPQGLKGINFPVAFPTAPTSIVVTNGDRNAADIRPSINGRGATGFTVQTGLPSTLCRVDWVAEGY